MKKVIGLILFVFMITACAGYIKSRTAEVRLNKQDYTIYVQAEDSPVSSEITLFVNGAAIAKGEVTTAGPTAVLSGEYNGIKFDADCKIVKTTSTGMSQRCIVFVGAEKVAELTY